MTTRDHTTIDFVAKDDSPRSVILVLVEDRSWGEAGKRLPDLQTKLETYLNYVLSGRLKSDYPAVANDPVTIELRCLDEPGARERELIDIVVRNYLEPEHINFKWTLL